jgi:hypothetical protein
MHIDAIREWVEKMHHDRKDDCLASLIERLIETEEIRWSDERKEFYWDSCGDPI